MKLEYITKENAPTDAEIMQYMKLPLILFRSAEWKQTLSLSAKVLYCFLLDRSNLSLKNPESFTDHSGRAFIFFSWDEAMDTLQCGRQKVSKVFKELEGAELIERVHRGLGKSPKIYVKRFYNEIEVNTQACSATNSVEYENHTHEYENHTRYIESDLPNTYLPFSDLSEAQATETKKDEMDSISYEESVEKARQMLSSEKTTRFGSKKLAELCEILAWVTKTARKTLQISGIPVRTERIREKLWTMNPDQAAEVLQNVSGRKIKNRRNYLLTCLYHVASSAAEKAVRTPVPLCENAAAYQSFYYNI